MPYRHRSGLLLPGGGHANEDRPDPNYAGLPYQTNGSSIWYTPIGSSPANAANSATYVTNLATHAAGGAGSFSINAESGTPSRYVVHGNRTPFVTVAIGTAGSGGSGSISAPIPPYAVPEQGSDEEICVWDIDNDIEYSFIQFTGTYPNFSAGTCFCLSTASDTGVMPAPRGSKALPPGVTGTPSTLPNTQSATGLSYLAGLITAYEVNVVGAIRHAMLFSPPSDGTGTGTTSVVPPATFSDNQGNSAYAIPAGSRFYFPAGTPAPSFTCPLAEMIWNALLAPNGYGMYVADWAGGYNCLYAENAVAWKSLGLTDPWAGPSNGLTSGQSYGIINNFPWSSGAFLAPA